jgi:hypothetical protein
MLGFTSVPLTQVPMMIGRAVECETPWYSFNMITHSVEYEKKDAEKLELTQQTTKYRHDRTIRRSGFLINRLYVQRRGNSRLRHHRSESRTATVLSNEWSWVRTIWVDSRSFEVK